jgi:hypothetical protein
MRTLCVMVKRCCAYACMRDSFYPRSESSQKAKKQHQRLNNTASTISYIYFPRFARIYQYLKADLAGQHVVRNKHLRTVPCLRKRV